MYFFNQIIYNFALHFFVSKQEVKKIQPQNQQKLQL